MAAAGMGFGAGLVIGAVVIIIFASAIDLIIGIYASKHCNNPAKANTLYILGIVLIVIAVVSLIFNIASARSGASGAIGIILPILLTIGAYQNKKAVGQ